MTSLRFRAMITILTALTLPALLSSCGVEERPEPGPAFSVTTMNVAAARMPRLVTYPGTVEGRTRVSVSTKLMGTVSSIPVEEGEQVGAGQLLVAIRSDDLKAKRAQIDAGRAEARAAFTNISANHARMSELYAKKSASRKEMEDVQMAFDMARARAESADEMAAEIEELLRYADIRSPITGTVVGKYVQAGDLANPGMPLVAVEDTRELRVNFSVPESEIGRISRGTPVSVAVGAAGGEAIVSGSIVKVNPSGDPASRRYQVQARIDPPPGARVRSGMFAAVSVESGERDAIAVPESVLVRRGQLDGVYILTPGGEALLRWVRTGERYGEGRVEILSGLSGGEEIITTPDARITDGVRVGVNR